MEKNNIIPSAHPIYRSRANFPGEGMYLQNLGEIMKKIGTTTETLDTSQLQSESVMNRPISVLTPLKMPVYVMVNAIDIEAIAQAIEQHKAVPIIFYGSLKEWTNVPKYNPLAPQNLNHCVCAVDYFLYNGKKAILIDDSWGKATSIGNGGQRVITEDYLIKRAGFAMYFIADVFPPEKPKYTFTKKLTFGMMRDADVRGLQSILAYEGYFPTDAVYQTGNMLQVTCNGLKKWQIRHDILDFQNETDVRKIVFGPRSILKANALYS